jgi:hypothetical protein
MSKIKGFIGIIVGLLIAIVYTLGTVVDYVYDIELLDWRLFLIVPIWLVIMIIALMIVFLGLSSLKGGSGAKFFESELGNMLKLEKVLESETFKSRWPETQAIGRKFTNEKDLAQRIKVWDELKKDILSLGDDLVTEGTLDSIQWMKTKMDLENFSKKVASDKINMFDYMYLTLWVFPAN